LRGTLKSAATLKSSATSNVILKTISEADYLSEIDLEVVRAEITRADYIVDNPQISYSNLILGLLMAIQVSSLWSKFIIGAAFNYEGVHAGVPKYDIVDAIPGFSYGRYTEVTGVYYSLTYGLSALFAGLISDNF
jgi:hypothetical protein